MLVAMPALEQASYFEVNKRNLIVFEDQIFDATKDKRIMNLFTRGSHHRNTSVIYMMKNLFHQGKKNPPDKLQILTLAKHYVSRAN